jgi:hypothetical protein
VTKEIASTLTILATSKEQALNRKGSADMNKRELINDICEINRSASPEFLARFTEDELGEYLEHLMELDLAELAVCG